MTAKEIKDKAESYSGLMVWMNKSVPIEQQQHEMYEYVGTEGYIAGATMILESEEYRLLVHEARLWRRHQEIVNNKNNERTGTTGES